MIKVLEILYEIIDSVNGINGIYGKGVPIGNYLSQYFANLYLTGFDHWQGIILPFLFAYIISILFVLAK